VQETCSSAKNGIVQRTKTIRYHTPNMDLNRGPKSKTLKSLVIKAVPGIQQD
jgi:hypothetical protein